MVSKNVLQVNARKTVKELAARCQVFYLKSTDFLIVHKEAWANSADPDQMT